MNIFELILSPFIFIIEQLLLLGYAITGSYGLAIVLLSLSISLLLLPVFILIERAKRKNDTVKQRMKPVLDEIKRCYKGQERYYYIKTLHRQHGYSPFRAMIPVLSLLLQIPFFIAAYQFLLHFEPLAGQSFLFISDLSAPDGLFGSVNILPIAMTLVNIVTAYFYTRNGDTSERNQMLAVAGVFLVLLFNLPAGLVLYWTMNNVFSFFRLFVTNREVFRLKIKRITLPSLRLMISRSRDIINKYRIAFFVIVSISIISQIKWALKYDFDTILIRILLSFIFGIIATLLIGWLKRVRLNFIKFVWIKPYLFYSALILAIYFYSAGKFYYTGPDQHLLFISLLFILPLQFFCFAYFIRNSHRVNLFISGFFIAVFASVFVFQAINAVSIISNKEFVVSFASATLSLAESSLSKMALIGILLVLATLFFYNKSHRVELSAPHKYNLLVYLLSILYLFGLVFLWHPLIVYSTFPEVFMFSGSSIIANHWLTVFICIAVSLGLYYIAPKGLRSLLAILAVVLVAVSFFNAILLPVDVGTLQNSFFEKQQALEFPYYYFYFEASIMLGLFLGTLWLFKREAFRPILFSLIVLNAVTPLHSLYKAIDSGDFLRKERIYRDSELTIRFSKTEQNVVYIIPDMLQGWAMNQIMVDEPNINDQLSGFTWYPNTLSVSRVTNTSIPPMLGGHSFEPDSLDLDTERTIFEKVSAIKQAFAGRVRAQGYTFTSNRIPYCSLDDSEYDTFIPEWDSDWDIYNQYLGIDGTDETNYVLLASNAIFFSAPLAVKASIYNEGRWFHEGKPKRRKVRNTSTSLYHQFLRLLPYISRSNASEGNFVLLYSFAPHFPWYAISEDGSLIWDVTPYETNLWVMRTLAEWIEWMKRNDVYDNTRIVIASDHGVDWDRYGKIDIASPVKNVNEKNNSEENILMLNPLLLVKDFNSTGSLQTDWRFMSNMDAPSILFGDDDDPTRIAPPLQRRLPAYISWWTADMNNRKRFALERKYLVKDNVFDGSNWEMVWDRHLGAINTKENQ